MIGRWLREAHVQTFRSYFSGRRFHGDHQGRGEDRRERVQQRRGPRQRCHWHGYLVSYPSTR